MKMMYIILVVVFCVIAFVGAFYGYQIYQSNTYNTLLNQSENNMLQSESYINQTSFTSGSAETNMQYIYDAENSTAAAINETEEMENVAPDTATYQYAVIRLDELQNMSKSEDNGLRIFQDMQTNGVFAAAIDAVNLNSTITATNNNISTNQNLLIQLVNNNPPLKQRLTNILGQNTVNQMLSNT